jgi:hypothetical protein
MAVAGLILVVIWSSPLWNTNQMVGIYDWDSTMQRFEAMRVTLVEFHQWPGNNIWMTGGTPLIANPNNSVLSIKSILVLALGTFWGVRLSVIVYLAIGFLGAWRLATMWWDCKRLQLVFALLVVSNPAMAYHTTVGHLVFQTFWFTPLLIYYLMRMHEDRYSGLKVGVILGIAFVDSPSYMVQYQCILVCILAGFMLLRGNASVSHLWRFSYLFVPTILFLGFYRATNLLPIAFAYPRVPGIGFHVQLWYALSAYFIPHTSLERLSAENRFSVSWEVCCYLGTVGSLFWLAGLVRGIRWWHIMTLLVVWASLGSDAWFYPMFWLQKIPSFSSHLCFTRIRVFAQLFFCIGAVVGLEECLQRCREWPERMRWVVPGVTVLMLLEVLVVSHLIFRQSHNDTVIDDEANYSAEFRSAGTLPRPPQAQGRTTFVYLATRKNIGWLRGFGLPWFTESAATKAIGQEEPGYIAEYHQDGKGVSPVLWSPNRLVFRNLVPDVPLVLNMNKSNAWQSGGQSIFPEARIVDMSDVLTVMPDSAGVVDIQYEYPFQRLGLIGTGIFGFLLVGIIAHLRMADVRPHGPISEE